MGYLKFHASKTVFKQNSAVAFQLSSFPAFQLSSFPAFINIKNNSLQKSKLSRAIVLSLIAANLLGGIGQSWAACDGLGGQCVVTDGSTVSFTGGIYETTGPAPAQTALYASGNGSEIEMTGGELRLNPPTLTSGYAARAENGGEIHFDNTKINGWGGIHVDNAKVELGDKSTIAITGDNVNALTLVNGSNTFYTFNATNTFSTSGTYSHGIAAEGMGTDILLHTVKINTTGDHSHGIFVKDYIYFTDIYGAADIRTQGAGSRAISAKSSDVAIFEEVKLRTEGDNSEGLYLTDDARFYTFKEVTVETRGAASHAIVLAGETYAQIGDSFVSPDSRITTHGANAYGVLFEENPGAWGDSYWMNQAYLSGVSLDSRQAGAIMVRAKTNNSVILWDGEIKGADRLVEVRDTVNGDRATLELQANNSKLLGGAAVDAKSYLWMRLRGNSEWTIRHDAAGNGLSEISILEFNNSSIRFDAPSSGVYQTLRIGAGDPGTHAVYNATGNASVTLNTLLNEGGDWSKQFTDRLLIEGDVSGQTVLKINEMPGSPGGQTSPNGANLAHEGISLVQVSGNAAENSFALDGGYVTMGGLPYTYQLYAYGPGSSNGSASSDPNQKQVGGNAHWDYRLQGECIGPCPPPPPPPPPPKQVAPQLANYLVAPSALFHVGLQDISSLHQHLSDMRLNITQQSALNRDEFFLRGVSGDYHYRSNLSAMQYGYNADIRYAAMHMGGNVYAVDSDTNLLRFGLSSSRGNLAFTPQREASQQTKMERWAIAPYLTWRHETGAHLDAVVSYGHFDGWVTTPARGRTARLQGQTYAASIETGLAFVWPAADIKFEPQLQLVYQKLIFDPTRDVDNFSVTLGNPEQSTLRVGAELSKQLAHAVTGQTGTLYGNFNLIHSMNDEHTAWFGDNFAIGRSGTHLKTGAGMQITLGKHANLYSDVTWQAPISNAGTRGYSLNFGFKVRF